MDKKELKVLTSIEGGKSDAQAEMLKALKDLAAIAPEIARTKIALYKAYISVGFNPDQALELSKSITV